MSVEKIYVAGHRGMVGSAIVRQLLAQGVAQSHIITRTHADLDLTNQLAVQAFFAAEKPTQVYLAAAKVGGIHANNTYPADFIYENLMVQANVIDAAFKNGVKKLLFLGSSCIYPRMAQQPMREDALLTGTLEPTNEPYAIAKIAGIKLCESYNRQYGISHGVDYRSVMPTNLYGPGDNYHPENSHVIPALIRKFHEARINGVSRVIIWGDGKAKRDFLYVDDLSKASVFIMNIHKKIFEEKTNPMLSHINVGYGEDITIFELSHKIAKILDYKGKIDFNCNELVGAPRKILDSSIILSFGWKPLVKLEQGLEKAYKNFMERN